MYTLLLLICFGEITLQLVKCYSDGNFDFKQEVCSSMTTEHHDEVPLPEESKFPFTIDPRVVYAENSTTSHTVTLGTKGPPFTGFMLEARNETDGKPLGEFILLEPDWSRLQKCFGTYSAVTHIDNRDKKELKVNWSAPAAGMYGFVATFVYEGASLPRSKFPFNTTAAPSTSTSQHTTTTGITTVDTTITSTTVFSSPTITTASVNETTTPASTTGNTTVNETTTPASTTVPSPTTHTSKSTTPPPPPCLCKEYVIDVILALLLLSCLFTAEALYLLMKHRNKTCLIAMRVCSILSVLCSVVAFILLLVCATLIVAQILTGLAVLFCLCQITVIFLFRGPTHELKRHCCWAFGVTALINLGLMVAAIFVLLVLCYKCLWLIIVMAAYLACNVLFCLYYLAFGCINRKNQHGRVASRNSWWQISFTVSTLVNVTFTLALIIGVCLCPVYFPVCCCSRLRQLL